MLHVMCTVSHLQESSCKTHRANKVLILGNTKMLLTSGTSRYNDRQIALWDQVRDVTEQCSKTFATKYHNFTKSFCVFCSKAKG